MNILQNITSVLFHPTVFFESKKDERGIGKAFVHGLVLLVISLAIWFVYIFAITGISSFASDTKVIQFSVQTGLSISQLIICEIVLYHILFLLGMLVVPLFLHLGIKIVGGTATLDKAYQVWIYGATPQFFLLAFPISGLGYIWMIFLQVKGLSCFYGVSVGKACLGWVIQSVLGAVTVIVVVAALFFTIVSLRPGILPSLTNSTTQSSVKNTTSAVVPFSEQNTIWKTFSVPQFAYQVSYPSDWTVSESIGARPPRAVGTVSNQTYYVSGFILTPPSAKSTATDLTTSVFVGAQDGFTCDNMKATKCTMVISVHGSIPVFTYSTDVNLQGYVDPVGTKVVFVGATK